MTQQVALEVRDALDPVGGGVELTVETVCSPASDQEIEIRRSTDQKAYLGPDGWQDVVYCFYAIFKESSDGSTVFWIGPDVVNQLSHGTVVEISFPELGLAGQVSWPDVPPGIHYVGSSEISDEESDLYQILSTPIDSEMVDRALDSDIIFDDAGGLSTKSSAIVTTPVKMAEERGANQLTTKHYSLESGDNKASHSSVQREGRLPIPFIYKIYQWGFFIVLPLLVLSATQILRPMIDIEPNTDKSEYVDLGVSGDVNHVVDVLRQVLLEPLPPESPLGRQYDQGLQAEELFHRAEAYIHPVDSAEYSEAIYWNIAAARLGHHDALIRLGGLMMGEAAMDESSDVLGGLTVLALGGLLATRPIDLPKEPSRGPAIASSQLGRWVFKSTDDVDTGYALYRWIDDAANSEELLVH